VKPPIFDPLLPRTLRMQVIGSAAEEIASNPPLKLACSLAA
jgi:hypothetical protein